ncbi:transferrin 1 [Arctopsyche grandis]|uniref:transferrin 1 n=1 Tax=Arctopsyche grandis TaxID=121162 RepID=UPI00406D96DB
MKILKWLVVWMSFYINSGHANSYKMCVPKIWLTQCEEMVKESTKTAAEIQCVPARDRVECLSFIQQRHADFIPVEPEDMYLAKLMPNQDFYIFQEIRTIEEPVAEYRYQAVMVVKNTLQINSLEGLKGLKSCHTGINRNVGYKIPLTMLMKRGIIGSMNDLSLSPKENELKALSQMFNKSCIVGKWSLDPTINTKLKTRYSNLCGMCEKPSVCDYPDDFSGYDGALRCLARNNGDVAFTKVIYVRMFFGLPVGTIPATTTNENPDDYSYLCADGSKMSVKEKPCAWAARPWQGMLAHQDLLDNVDPLRNKLRELGEIGKNKNSTWFYNVLTMSEYIHYLYDNTPITPNNYLDKSNYTIVIERGHGEPEPVVRLCVTSDVALSKCRIMASTAYSRDIRPQLQCVQDNSDDDCLQMVQDDKADAASVAGNKVKTAMIQHKLSPLFSETYDKKTSQYAVAVVKKGTSFNSWNDLQNKRSCHKSYDSVEGFTAPVYSLIKHGFIKEKECGRLRYLLNFFSAGSCIPGALEGINNPNEYKLATQQCESGGESSNDPIKCLDDNRGDVAFVSNLDALLLSPEKYQLICLDKANGGRAEVSDWENCNLMQLPPLTWMGVDSRPKRPTDSITHLMLAIFDLVTNYRVEILDLFGEYLKHNNVIFNGNAQGLVASDLKWFNDFDKIVSKVKCD